MKAHRTYAKFFFKKHSIPFPISYTLMLVAYLAKIFVAAQSFDKCPSVSMKAWLKKAPVWGLPVD